jgi:hypothetical protein
MPDPNPPGSVAESAQYNLQSLPPELAAEVDDLIQTALAPVMKRIRKLERRESEAERDHRLVSVAARAAREAAWKLKKKAQRDRARKRRATPGNQDVAKRRKILQALKLAVLSWYSPDRKLGCSCPGCHIRALPLLTLDHEDGRGNEHRDSQGRRITGATLYKMLKDAGFPPGYQAMCMSCNFAKRQNKQCPLAGTNHLGE